jgi:hypothetical protein
MRISGLRGNHQGVTLGALRTGCRCHCFAPRQSGVKNPIARANSMKAPKAQIAMFSELLMQICLN